MDNGSYWRGYFMARHHVFLVLGMVLEAGALISTLTGRTFVKYQGIVSRATDPKTFQDNVVFYYLFGFFFVALYFCTFN